jgi:hypothetical protein
MGKTLRNIVLCSMLAVGSLFIGGCKVKIQGNVQNTYNISDSASEKQESKTDISNKNKLEDYLLQGDELKSISLSSENLPNPVVINREDFNKEGRIQAESDKILRVGVGEYTIPKIEGYSEIKNFALKVLEFESAKDRENFVKNRKEITYPLFIKDNTVSLIEPTSENHSEINLESLSPKQKEIYTNILQDYINRTGAEAILSGDKAEQERLLKTIQESYVADKRTEENSTESKIISSSNSASTSVPKSNITNEPVNTTKGLESYFFSGDELKFLRFSLPYVAGTNLSNPVVIDSKNSAMSEKDRESFKTNKILKEGIGEYILEDIESYSRQRDLFLEILEFESEADKRNFIEKELGEHPYFSKGKILTTITPDIHLIDSEEFSRTQKVVYINLIKNYSKRTGLDMVLYGDETKNRELLGYMDKFVEEYYLEKGIPNK